MNIRSRILTYGMSVVAICALTSAVSAAEIQLAGIRLAMPASKVLQKLGNPNDVQIGLSASSQQGAGQASGTAAGQLGGGRAKQSDNMRGGGGGMGGRVGALPDVAGAGLPGMTSGNGGMFGAQGATGTPATMNQQKTGSNSAAASAVTWVYYFPKGKKDRELRLTINSQGLVVEIEARAASWPGLRTSHGIALGSTYRDIIAKYGFPDSQEQQGNALLMKYREKHQLVFTLVPPVLGLPATVAGINIAL